MPLPKLPARLSIHRVRKSRWVRGDRVEPAAGMRALLRNRRPFSSRTRIDGAREGAMLPAMIFPRDPQTAADVGGHYDELDETYRSIWGEHVHHGYWRTGRGTPEEATADLVRLVADRLDLSSGLKLVDIGCGYGATA